MLLNKSDMKNFPFVLRILQMLLNGSYIGSTDIVSDGVTLKFVVENNLQTGVRSITGELMNHEEASPAVFFVVDNSDLFDDARDIKLKGTEVNVSQEGFYIDTCGVAGFTFMNSTYQLEDDDLESTLFQLSTVEEDIPDPELFNRVYRSALGLLNNNDLAYLNYTSYDDCLVLESDFEELQNAYENLCKG